MVFIYGTKGGAVCLPVYLETYVKDKAGRTFTMKVSDQTEAGAEADYADKSSDGRYFIRPYWGPADHSDGDQDVGDVSQTSMRNLYLRAWKECEGEVESGTVAQATTYDVSYMVMYTSEEDLRKAQFVALLSGTQCVTKEKGADDWLYIHDNECTDHSIVLYVEPFPSQGGSSKNIYCYYASADGEYYLRWLVGKSKNVNKNNAECCLYEKLITPSAAPLQIEESGYMEYRVTLNEQDVAGLKAHDRSRAFQAYIRREGASSYTEYPSDYTFSAANY